ncbi:hypothetical protein F751_0761 [Auxenochlorella protothecoides]|uniref:Uncharacterized protein n=1 Tax=Auxenochlorella protothecoides TaxID=3075 RepID=A0A087SM75_AUXPR|nr:hypothetical protein F751_0761 [Auxenochlorella protothecoides]KFM26829.1 hypothetical protein F751_0761 [Auxenochlorella protothecoides]
MNALVVWASSSEALQHLSPHSWAEAQPLSLPPVPAHKTQDAAHPGPFVRPPEPVRTVF